MRVAIAEACGWRRLARGETVEWVAPKPYSPPDYLTDLNAMHEAERGLFVRNDWSASKYEEALQKATTSWAWHATAAQRAEAFCRTLWPERFK